MGTSENDMNEFRWDMEHGRREHGECILCWSTLSEETDDDANIYAVETKTYYVVSGPSGKTLLSLIIKW